MSHSAESSNGQRANGNGRAPLEFVGVSNDTIADAIRRALANAAASLRTLEGVAVLVHPHLNGHNGGPRFQVTLEVTRARGTRARVDTPPIKP
jgi:flavin-binding protein dodecin